MRIEIVKPSVVRANIAKKQRSPFVDLIQGYDLIARERDNPRESAMLEYDAPDETTDVYLVWERRRLIGSLALQTLVSVSSYYDERSRLFWQEFRRQDHTLAERIHRSRGAVHMVAGIIVNPSQRGRGIATKMYEVALEREQPVAIVGQTKTPAAVMTRRKLWDHGFLTYFGSARITPGYEQRNVSEHYALMAAFLSLCRDGAWLPEGKVHLGDTGIASTVPDVSTYPPIIQQAFAPLIQAQQRLHMERRLELDPYGDQDEKYTVMSPLVSVQKDVMFPGLR